MAGCGGSSYYSKICLGLQLPDSARYGFREPDQRVSNGGWLAFGLPSRSVFGTVCFKLHRAAAHTL